MPTIFEYIIKTSPSGRHSHSHSHHHHQQQQQQQHNHDSHYCSRTPAAAAARCFDSCAGVPVEKWNGLVERNHELAHSNEALARENQTLKSELQSAGEENARLSSCNQHLTAEVCSLRRSADDNNSEAVAASFRRRIAALTKEVGERGAEVESLRRKKGYLATRVHVLSETVSENARAIADLNGDLVDLQRHADRLKATCDKYRRLFQDRERDLEDSNRLVEEQRRRLRYLESPLPFRRGRRYSCA